MTKIEHVVKAIEDSTNNVSKIDDRVLSLEGMSNRKVRHLLNNIASLKDCNYLEIGCHKGSTIVSALFKNQIKNHWEIDSFSDPIKSEFIKNFTSILGYPPNLINKDYLSFNPIEDYVIKDVDVYFYDGEHTNKNQKTAISYYLNSMKNEFIYVCDDWFWWDVIQETKETIKELNLTVLYEKILPQNTDTNKDLWWNGVYVGVLKKPS